MKMNDEDEISRCEKCNKYYKDDELKFVEGQGVICSNCSMHLPSEQDD